MTRPALDVDGKLPVADNERGRCSCAGSIPAPLAIAAAAAAARHLGAGGVSEESLSQPSIARVVSAEAFKDDNYARVQSQLGVFLQMRSLPTAATGREMVLMTAAHGGPVRKPRSKLEGQGDGGGCLDPFLDTACESLAVFEMKKLLVFR